MRGAPDVARFLDDLAAGRRLSLSSQKQALNALVFLYEQVFERELGDLSEYQRGKERKTAPVWLTTEELFRLLKCLSPAWQLMAKVMYAGLGRKYPKAGEEWPWGLGIRSPLDNPLLPPFG